MAPPAGGVCFSLTGVYSKRDSCWEISLFYVD